MRATVVQEAEQRFDLERQRIAAERARAEAENRALEAAKAAEMERLQAKCREEREKRLEAEKQLKIVSQSANAFLPSILPPPPAHTPVDFTFKSPGGPPPCSMPHRPAQSVFVPATHRWTPVTCMPCTTTQQVGYVFLPTGLVCGSDSVPAAATHTVSASPSMTLHVEPGATQSVPSGPAFTQPVATMTEHAPTMNECVFTTPRPIMPTLAGPVPTTNDCTHTAPRPALPVPMMHGYTHTVHRPVMSTMNEHTLAMPGPTMPAPTECVPTISTHAMPVHTGPTHAMSHSTMPMYTMPPASEMTYIVSSGALNSTHSLTRLYTLGLCILCLTLLCLYILCLHMLCHSLLYLGLRCLIVRLNLACHHHHLLFTLPPHLPQWFLSPRWCWSSSFNHQNPTLVPLLGRATVNTLRVWLQ